MHPQTTSNSVMSKLKEQELIRQAQKYKHMAQQLQEENAYLKKVVQDQQTLIKQSQSNKQDILSDKVTQSSRRKTPQEELDEFQELAFNKTKDQITKQNSVLKAQLRQANRTYQRQISQLASYLQNIRTMFRKGSLKQKNEQQNPKIINFIQIYHNMIMAAQQERKVYNQKIQELTRHIIKQEETCRRIQQQATKWEIQSKISAQKIKMIKKIYTKKK